MSHASDNGTQKPNTFVEIYRLVEKIPRGKVATYGQIARLSGRPRGARLVGYAMAGCSRREVPCHRVVNRFGGLTDAFMPEGKATHRMLLEVEGVGFRPDGTVNLEDCLWNPSEQE